MSFILKFLGLLLILSVSILLGFLKSYNLKKRLLNLNDYKRSLIFLSEHILNSTGEIEKLLSLCFKGNTVYIKKSKIEFDKAFLKKQDIDLLNEFFSNLGVRDKESEYDRTNLYINLIGKCVDEADEECKKLCKLYNTLGILGGIFICIILW